MTPELFSMAVGNCITQSADIKTGDFLYVDDSTPVEGDVVAWRLVRRDGLHGGASRLVTRAGRRMLLSDDGTLIPVAPEMQLHVVRLRLRATILGRPVMPPAEAVRAAAASTAEYERVRDAERKRRGLPPVS
jgi:hypothetical protein